MRLPRASPRRVREPIGPLVDVVFLLLVFFLLAGTLERPPPIEVEPPLSDYASARDGVPLRVLLDADGRVAFDGTVLEPADLGRAIQAHSGADRSSTVEVEADAQAATGAVLALFKQMRALGFETFQLSTRTGRLAADRDG